ncbi:MULTISPECIES: hypothetical protein [unclassified Bradyrhizobium]|nr:MULTISPECIES: hypothetical protein [unclassified Bradyrhizobium]MBB4259884.1 hypothetical protein [Bradyrhizobium sp. CIR3A]NYG49547.1 hypothetical protein [Bradyrhizobium sp. IAR9]
MPRLDRGIQYAAAAAVLRNGRHGVLDRPVEPGDDSGICDDELRKRMSM